MHSIAAEEVEPRVLGSDHGRDGVAVLSVLRWFLGVQVISLATAALAFVEHSSPRHPTVAVWVLLSANVLLFGLSFLPLAKGSRFVQVALAVLVLLPTLAQLLAFGQGVTVLQKMAIELSFLLAVPLILVAWTHGFRLVVAGTALVTVLDGTICLVSPLRADDTELILHLLVERSVALLLIGYIVARLVREQRNQHRLLAQAHDQLRRHAAGMEQLSVSRERNRVARELHDTLAHTLSAMAVHLEATGSTLLRDQARGERMVAQARSLTLSGLAEVRRALKELRASPIEDLGLVLALKTLGEQLEERAGVSLQTELPQGSLQLPPEIEQGVYRVAQEALSNVERHAHANNTLLGLRLDGDALSLVVEDDGCGFSVQAVAKERYGIVGMRERAELLGGELTIAGRVGGGTVLQLSIPAAALSRWQGGGEP